MRRKTIVAVTQVLGSPSSSTKKVLRWNVRRGLDVVVQRDGSSSRGLVWVPWPSEQGAGPFGEVYPADRGRHANTYHYAPSLAEGKAALKLTVADEVSLAAVVDRLAALKAGFKAGADGAGSAVTAGAAVRRARPERPDETRSGSRPWSGPAEPADSARHQPVSERRANAQRATARRATERRASPRPPKTAAARSISHPAAPPSTDAVAEVTGLVIKSPWIDLILRGEKTWEVRTRQTAARGRVALIRSKSGLIVGTCRIVDCLGPLSMDEMLASQDRHRVPPELLAEYCRPGQTYVWVIADARPLDPPIPYRHPSGAVIWVRLTRQNVPGRFDELVAATR